MPVGVSDITLVDDVAYVAGSDGWCTIDLSDPAQLEPMCHEMSPESHPETASTQRSWPDSLRRQTPRRSSAPTLEEWV